MLALDERSENQDLRGSGCQSVIPYIHGRKRVVLSKHWFFLSVDLSGLEHSNAVAVFYSTRLQRLHCVPVPDRWP
jgi:hypothetical protein